ncbi:inositol 1,4,5-triphosphate receptor associated 2 isoform X2 [Triplophysa rosa]|uniref:inositol 1,4,5-triphosphate receptor associated 2 isoform X2 n=1 Tax=Triplophysa rosa TaxID=992332 RepID=UPI002545D89F|nr:inositol 1,4,5-triphosphate receptor associated 2 isoform X2 [Triplophysa rosa]
MMNDPQPFDYTRELNHSHDEEDDDEDPNSDKPHDSSCENLSILERLGLNSTLEMREDEVESAFIRLAVGFRCDQYTLNQRLQAERHERLVAEENFQRELRHTGDTLQVLCDRLTEVDSRETVSQMKNRLQMVEKNVENVVTAAEMLGAAHQEARVSHAADVMSAHVEHLKRRHMTDSEELLEVRKLLHRRKGRLHSDSTDDRDAFFRLPQQSTRRRVSVTLLPTSAEMMDLETVFLQSTKTSEESDRRPHIQKLRRPEMMPSDSIKSSLTFDPSAQDSALKQDDDDADSAVFPCVTQAPVEGEESVRGEEPSLTSSSELCVAPPQRPLLVWSIRVLPLVFCLIILAALWF